MEKIIKDIKEGKLCRCNDESNAGGLWDYSFELAGKYKDELSGDSYEDIASEIYYSLWELVDLMSINKCEECK
jgi:hypothetical protein